MPSTDITEAQQYSTWVSVTAKKTINYKIFLYLTLNEFLFTDWINFHVQLNRWHWSPDASGCFRQCWMGSQFNHNFAAGFH